MNNLALTRNWIQEKPLMRLVLIGLLIRLVLIPFFGHVDLLSEARRVFFWAEEGIYLDNIGRNTTMFIQVVFFKFTSLFLPEKSSMLYHLDMTRTTAEIPHYFEFVSHPTIYRTIFALKLPFLIADLLIALCVYRYFDEHRQGIRAAALWLFNPVTLFAFYIFGRFEAIPILFVMGALLALKNKRLILAAILLGLCVNAREMNIFYAPIFVAMMFSFSANEYSIQRRLIAVAIVAVLTAIALQIIPVVSGGLDAFGRDSVSIANESRVDGLYRFKIGGLAMFPMFYFIATLFAWNSKVSLPDKSIFVFALAMMSFFLFASHTAHFSSWMILFPALFYGYNRALLKPFIIYCCMWIIYNLLITDLGVYTLWLASPWAMGNAGIPNFPALYQQVEHHLGPLDLATATAFIRTFYVTSIGYMIFQMWQTVCERKRTEEIQDLGKEQ